MGKLIAAKLPASILKSIVAQAEKEYPDECCGMILASKNSPDKLARVRPCRNAQDEYHLKDPENFPRTAKTSYFMEPRELLAVQKEIRGEGLVMRVIYHSHIDAGAYFSEEDKRMALCDGQPAYPGVDYLVLSIARGKMGGMNLFHWDSARKDFIS